MGIRIYLTAALMLILAGCSTGERPQTSTQVLGTVIKDLWAARGTDPPSIKVTQTRAQLAQLLSVFGLADAALIVARVPATDSETGLLRLAQRDGVELWQSTDGQASLRLSLAGPVVASVGFGADLYGADTAPLAAALKARKPGQYGRVYRHLGLDNTTLRKRQVYCSFVSEGPERVTVFERDHATELWVERCVAAQPHPDGSPYAFENRFWIGRQDGVIWVSEQWMSQNLGTIRLERVFN